MGYTALYRKWRPETFDDIVGQDTIVKTLENQINLGRIGHAYLFSGPRGTGKTSTAKVFAKAVNCTDDKNANPCGKCKVCLRSAAGDMLDIIEIDAASNNGVDEIRDLRNKAKFPPTLGRFKIYIIDEVHMLSQGAFNALLKTLEEPPPHVIFILATTEAHRLPATIISRCQHFAFKLILLKDIVDHLRSISQISNITIDDEALYTIARWAQGGLRDAISLFDQCIGFSGNKISNEDVLSMLGTANEPFMFEMVDAILEGDITFAFNSVDMLIQDGRDISIFVRDIITHMRNLLIIKASNNKASSLIDASPSTVELYKKQAKTAGQMRVFRAVDLFVSLESELKWSNQPRVLLELTIAKLCRPEDEKGFESLVDRLETLEDRLENIHNVQSIQKGPKIVESKPLTDRADILDSEDNEANAAYTEPSKENEPTLKGANIDYIPADNKLNIDELPAPNPKSDDIDLANIWPEILKAVKKERIALYPLVKDARLKVEGNIVQLLFSPDQGFLLAAIDREENRKFIEDMILKVSGESFRLSCALEGEEKIFKTKEDPLVQKAIDIFGKANVEIVDDM